MDIATCNHPAAACCGSAHRCRATAAGMRAQGRASRISQRHRSGARPGASCRLRSWRPTVRALTWCAPCRRSASSATKERTGGRRLHPMHRMETDYLGVAFATH